MSDTLATLIDKVQGILGDTAGTYFTDALCTAAIRQALSEWNLHVPTFAAVTITGIDNQYEYELSDEDANAIKIVDVLRQGTTSEVDTSIDYDEYWEDNRLFFRLRAPITSSQALIVRYAIVNTINGLDSETESTLISFDDQAIVDGGAFFAIVIRATGKVETINLSQDQADNYREIAPLFASAFNSRMAQAAQRRAPVSEPDARAWKDKYDTPSWKVK